MYDHHSISHPMYHHPHHHLGHPVHPHHHRHPPPPPPHPHQHQHHMHPVPHHPSMTARPPLANKTVHPNIQTYDPQPQHWQKPMMSTIVQKPLQPPLLPPPQMEGEHIPSSGVTRPPAQPKQELATPQLSKTQRQQFAVRQVKTPITLCFERMLGAGK